MDLKAANDNAPPVRPQWFDELLLKYTPFIRGRCNRISGRLDANEVYQDTIVLCLRYWYQFKPERPTSNFAAWLGFKCRVAAAGLRKANAAAEHVALDETIPDTRTVDSYSDMDINRLLEFVIPEQAEAIRLIEQGYTYAEIGAMSGLTKQCIHLRANAGREIIKSKMRQADFVASVCGAVAANDNEPRKKVA